ncbi:Metallophosphoesterase domain-containing protein 1 [Paramyrothecium foliicola]|nr:Metallophosphoesterase domain-containing protein 1 [Paramyrothecium foliicola]
MVKTRILIISDTHGVKPVAAPIDTNGTSRVALIEQELATSRRIEATGYREPLPEADVVLHCGDLTKRSKPDEFERTFDMLRAVRAPLKLAIAGNHDSALDERYYIDELGGAPTVTSDIKRIIADAEQDGVRYLDEGVYRFNLENGARLTVYASQWTPQYGGWGFQYEEGTHTFDIPSGVDIAMTHGPPLGMLDYAALSGTAAGCPELFRAVYRARPKVHCFGHIHEGWGAHLAKWKEGRDESSPRRATVIDEEASRTIKVLRELWPSPSIEDAGKTAEKTRTLAKLSDAGGVHVDLTEGDTRLAEGEQTLFVNAAIMDIRYRPNQLPWLVDIDLPPL